MSKITPFVPITERVLDEEHKVSWRERFCELAKTLAPVLGGAIGAVAPGTLVRGNFSHLLRPGLKQDFLDAYKDFPAAPNIIIPKVGNFPGKMWFLDD